MVEEECLLAECVLGFHEPQVVCIRRVSPFRTPPSPRCLRPRVFHNAVGMQCAAPISGVFVE